MSGPWDGHLVEVPAGPLPERLRAFLASQVAGWPKLGEAIDGVGRVRVREVRVADRQVRIQWNPGRATSSTAKVDPATVKARPCFLCPANHPPEERGLAFGDRWVILPNPAPILDRHLVIADRDHRPQDVLSGLAGMLDFALAAGPDNTVIYNGPRSGASAPDHLHLQSVAAGLLPEEVQARGGDARPFVSTAGFRAWHVEGAGRAILGLAGERGRVEDAVRFAVGALGSGPEEPQLNLLATVHGDELLVLLFPRGAHRPACFFAEGPAQCVVSPGVIDMAGLVVTVREQDFEALDGSALEGIFREVTLPQERWTDWNEALVRRWSDG